MESWHKHPSSLRHEKRGRKWSPQSARRDRICAKWTTRRVVGLCDGMLLQLAQRAQQNGRWHDSIRATFFVRKLTDHQFLSEHWLSAFRLPRRTNQKEDSWGEPQAIVASIVASNEQWDSEKTEKSSSNLLITLLRRSIWKVFTVCWFIGQSLFKKIWKYQEAKAAEKRMWEMNETKVKSVKRKKMKTHFTSRIWWIFVAWKAPNLQNTSRNTRCESCSGGTPSWTKKDTWQYSQSKVILFRRRQRQNSCTLSQSFLVWLERQVTQFERSVRSWWPKLTFCDCFQEKNVQRYGSRFFHDKNQTVGIKLTIVWFYLKKY